MILQSKDSYWGVEKLRRCTRNALRDAIEPVEHAMACVEQSLHVVSGMNTLLAKFVGEPAAARALLHNFCRCEGFRGLQSKLEHAKTLLAATSTAANSLAKLRNAQLDLDDSWTHCMCPLLGFP